MYPFFYIRELYTLKRQLVYFDMERRLEELEKENQILKAEIEDLKRGKRTFKNAFAKALNQVADSVMAISADGRLLYANKHYVRIHGLDEDWSHYTIYDLPISFNTPIAFLRKIVEIKNAPGGVLTYTCEYRNEYEKKNGILKVSAVILEHEGEDTMWFFGMDVTELVKSQNKLKESNRLLKAIMDNVPVSLFVKDTGDDFRYLYWSKAFTRISAILEEKALGHTDYDIFPNREDADKFRRDDLELVRTNKRLQTQESYLSASGQRRIVETIKVLVPMEQRAPLLVGVSIDVGNLEEIEKELIHARIKAEESDRLKTTFLASMSHEIRTPLNAIVGFAQLLGQANSDEERNMYSDIISQNSEILLQLINDILDLAKIEAGTLEFVKAPMDMEEICLSQYEIHRNRPMEGVTLVKDTPGNEFIIRQDKNRIMQLYTNLINNAMKFTSEGEIRFGYTIGDGMIHGFVSDTGIGIALEQQKTVFDRFVKLNSFVQGTGLGLSICKLITDTMGGSITLESEIGKGTTFRFTIPME